MDDSKLLDTKIIHDDEAEHSVIRKTQMNDKIVVFKAMRFTRRTEEFIDALNVSVDLHSNRINV